jgi:perosamine synthetase
MKNLNNYTISHKASLYDGLKKMDLGSDGVLLILNGKKLIGILTDGDYRRLVIEKVDFNDSITLHANKKFTFSYEDESMEQKLTKLSRKINHLPIMSSNGDLKDLITSKDLLHIPISNPNISGNEKKYVLDAINSGWISSQGKYVKAFEDSLRDYLNTSKKNINLTTTSSGTAALELVLKALGIKKGDEVIVPTVTFGATASSIINIGARPVFVDVDLSTFNIDINLINNAVTKKTKAIIVVHLYGNPADLQKIDQICKKNNILLIEDAAEALGSKYKDEFCGLFGDAGIFSFFANKLITTGEGGAAIFKNTEHLKVALTIKNHGMDSKRKYWHNVVGNNYRLTNIQAALGLAQMEKIDSFLIRRKEIFEVYQKYFKRSDLFITPKIIKNTQSSYWLYPILRKEPHYDSFENLVEHFRKFSIETRPVFPPLHLQPAFREFNKKSMVISEKYFLHGVCLPISNKMSNKEVGIIKSCLESFFNEN